MSERMDAYDVMIAEATKAWNTRFDDGIFVPDAMNAAIVPSETAKPGIARRGSGEGFHSKEAKAARTKQHEMNAARKITPEQQARAWNNRLGEPMAQTVVFNGKTHQA